MAPAPGVEAPRWLVSRKPRALGATHPICFREWKRRFRSVAAEPDLEWTMLDAAVIRAHAQAAGARRKKGGPHARRLAARAAADYLGREAMGALFPDSRIHGFRTPKKIDTESTHCFIVAFGTLT